MPPKLTPKEQIKTDKKKIYTSLESLKRTEPLVCLVSNLLNHILQVSELEYNGKIVKVNGFRLKKNKLISNIDNLLRARRFSSSPQHITLPRKICNASCVFCYEKGTPEVIDRTDLTGGDKKFLESLIIPDYINNLKQERIKNPEKVLTVYTNGLQLKESVISQLANLKPLIVKLGFYSR